MACSVSMEAAMKSRLFFPVISLVFAVLLSPIAASQQQIVASEKQKQYSPQAQQRIIKDVRHALLMLPYYGGAFDYIAFRLKGDTVILQGQVVRATLHGDAEKAVSRVEGVEHVVNQIEVLPPSRFDDQLRFRLYHAIYGFPALQRYGVGSNRAIQIIVNRGHVTLEGIVDRQADKNMAFIRANGVPGVFSVTNNLQVEGGAPGL